MDGKEYSIKQACATCGPQDKILWLPRSVNVKNIMIYSKLNTYFDDI